MRAGGDACGLKSSNRDVANAPAAPSERRFQTIPCPSMVPQQPKIAWKRSTACPNYVAGPTASKSTPETCHYHEECTQVCQNMCFQLCIPWEASTNLRSDFFWPGQSRRGLSIGLLSPKIGEDPTLTCIAEFRHQPHVRI
jgi:hypothetical protein